MLNQHLKTRRIVRFAGAAAAPDPAALNAAVDRRTLRGILLAGLDDAVHFGKEFTHYEQGVGGLRAHFADGTTTDGDVLVAADGVGSRVRGQYLPHAAVVDTGGRCIYGKTPLTAETRPFVPAALADGFTAVVGPHAVGLALGLMEFGQRPEAAALGSAVALHSQGDYLMWGLTARRERFALADAASLALDSPGLQRVALRMTTGWDASVGALIARCAVGETFALAIRTAVPLAPWSPTTVTLLGDAIHAMSPAGGSGANTALRDAGLLCHQLGAAARGGAAPGGHRRVRAGDGCVRLRRGPQVPAGIRTVRQPCGPGGAGAPAATGTPSLARKLSAPRRRLGRLVTREGWVRTATASGDPSAPPHALPLGTHRLTRPGGYRLRQPFGSTYRRRCSTSGTTPPIVCRARQWPGSASRSLQKRDASTTLPKLLPAAREIGASPAHPRCEVARDARTSPPCGSRPIRSSRIITCV